MSSDPLRVSVYGRSRPASLDESKASATAISTEGVQSELFWDSAKKALSVGSSSSGKSYSFDNYFDCSASQSELFESSVLPLVKEAANGFSCAVIAYGAAQSGKTFCLEGANIRSEASAGMIPRAGRALLELLDGKDFTLKASFLEIYNEQLLDLLAGGDSSSLSAELCIADDLKRGPVCQGLSQHAVSRTGDLYEVLQRGIYMRQTNGTYQGKEDKHRHTVFTLTAVLRESSGVGEEVVKQGQISFFDLAADNFDEGSDALLVQGIKAINAVTNALAEKRKSGAPYLDSKVSRLLQEAIGGKARTCVIATFSPAKQQLSSSSATAQMSQSFRAVENQPSMSNKELQKKTIALNEYLNELEGLKAQLAAAREKNGVYLEPAALNTMQSQIAKQEKEIADAQLALQSHQETIQSLTSDKAQLLLELSASKNEIADANKVIADLQQQLKAKSTAYDTIFEDNISMKATLQAVQNTVKQQAADLEEAKADKKLLQDQLELHTVQHEKTATTLKQTEFALKQAEADLARNTVEVKAAEAVIAEQSATEKTLLGHGSELQSDLIARQDDVKALHGKVDRFAAKEQERLNETTKFVATTNDKNNALTSEIAIIASSHADKTKILTDGYSSVLTAGRTACQEVKASLEIALVVLLSQSDASRHAIGQSSDQTKRHLQDFDSNMAKALKAMRDKIASWLSESEQHLSKAQKDLDEQKRQIEALSTHISDHTTSMASMTAAFMAQQAQCQAESARLCTELRASVKETVSQYKLTTQTRAAEATDVLKFKANALEKAVSWMLRDIYDSTSTAIDSSLDSATALCATVDKTVQIGLSDISKASEETHTSSGNHRDQADKAQSAACKSWMHQLDGVLASRLSAVEKTLEVSRKVPANKEELEQTVGKLVKDVDQAIEEGCAAVDRTSEMANKILTDVHSASTKMNNSASKSMDTFVMFMDKEGEAISVGLSTHFDSLKDHLQSQTEGLNEMRVQTVTHGKTVEESVVIPSGGTPPKTEYRKRAVLANTRSHEAIKDEVRRRNNQRIAEE